MLLRTFTCSILVLVCALAIPANDVLATVYEVKPDGTGDFPTIQAAVNAVVGGDIIELTDGTFMGNGNRDVDYLGKAITIRSQGGDPSTCVIDSQGSATTPHRGFIFQSGEGSDSVLENVTIESGYLIEFGRGAGVLCTNESSPAVRGCVLRDGFAWWGGGLACVDDSSPEVTDCEFLSNTATNGGGLACADWDSRPPITGCLFSQNTATGSGGGLYIDVGGGTVVDCDFIDNDAAIGGGVYFIDVFNHASLEDCRIVDNDATSDGGGLVVSEGDPTVTTCLFANNTSGERGGAITCYDSGAIIAGSTLYGNSAVSTAGGIWVSNTSNLTIDNTIISFSTQGEAIACGGSGSATLTCCDVFGNADGDWVGCIAGQVGVNGNQSADPLFCDAPNGDFTLHADSPCAPDHSGGCGLVGAYGVACGMTVVEPTSWGAIKASFDEE